MTHPPQEVLVKVMCSERLPDRNSWYVCVFKSRLSAECFFDVDKRAFVYSDNASRVYDDIIAWYEPATRIVLTEEEYSGICMKQYDEGYSDATKEARDEIANNYRPNDN